MPEQGWKRLTAGAPWFRGPGKYPIAAYSEFMPPPRLGRKPYDRGEDEIDAEVFDPVDPWGWKISEYEEAVELQAGLLQVAEQLLGVLRHLGRGESAHGIARGKLLGNPYWPERLHQRGAPAQERYVLLLPLAISRTQDDKGRLRWTLFGASQQGPGRAFWRASMPRRGPSCPPKPRWSSCAGCWRPPMMSRRPIWPTCAGPDCGSIPARTMPCCRRGTRSRCPRGRAPFRWRPGQSLRGVRYLLTFCPFDRLPATVSRAYLAGDLHLLPFPGSLLFFGAPGYLRLEKELPGAVQIPLLHSLHRHEAPWGIRIPQSGWMHEAPPGAPRAARGFWPDSRHIPPHAPLGPRDCATRTNWPRPRPPRTSWRTSSSAPPPATWASTASRWPAMPKSGPTISVSSSMVPGPRPPR